MNSTSVSMFYKTRDLPLHGPIASGRQAPDGLYKVLVDTRAIAIDFNLGYGRYTFGYYRLHKFARAAELLALLRANGIEHKIISQHGGILVSFQL